MSVAARKLILRDLGMALGEFHARNWIHIGKYIVCYIYALKLFFGFSTNRISRLDVKPDNVMLDYRRDEDGQITPERVVLSDLDCALKLKGDKLLRLPDGAKIRNVMWRSPEAQTGQGIGKASDVFSYGLVVEGALWPGLLEVFSAKSMAVSLHNHRRGNSAPGL